MNLTAHLIRKDWRRARPALLAWYALVAGKAWCVWQLLRSGDPHPDFAILGSFVNMLNGLEAVAGALLAAWLALEDPVYNPNAFWPTRPITRGRLLRAKILGALLFFLAAPLLLLAPVWLAAGFSAPEFCTAAADWTFVQGFFVALGLLAGVLAKDLNQALLGAPLLGLALLGITFTLRREPAPPLGLSAALGLAVATGGLALTHGLRRRGLVLAMIAIGFLAVAGLGPPALSSPNRLLAWPGPALELRDRTPREADAQTWRVTDFSLTGDRPFVVVQQVCPRPALLPDPLAGIAAPRFTLQPAEAAASAPLANLVPERVGTVQAASLHGTRWRFSLPRQTELPPDAARLAVLPAQP